MKWIKVQALCPPFDMVHLLACQFKKHQFTSIHVKAMPKSASKHVLTAKQNYDALKNTFSYTEGLPMLTD